MQNNPSSEGFFLSAIYEYKENILYAIKLLAKLETSRVSTTLT